MKTRITYLGGATYLLEIGSFRLLTDPGFDPKNTEKSEGPGHVLTKIMAPPVPVEEIGRIDAVLLSHQQHFDNLDTSGRALLPKAGRVLTTPESAGALNGNSEGLEAWQTVELTNAEGEVLRVTGTPAAHGLSREVRKATGETMGFIIEWEGQKNGAFYVTGDTVWFDGLEEVGKHFSVGTAIMHMGAAKVPAAGDNALTMNAEEATKLTQDLGVRAVFPAHFEGWMHYTQGRDQIIQVFEDANLGDRLNMLEPGQSVEIVV